MEEIPNTSPDCQVGVIPGTVGVADVGRVAVAQLLCRDAVVVSFPAGSGWSVQALLDQQASLDTLALVWGRVAVRVQGFPELERQLPLEISCFAK